MSPKKKLWAPWRTKYINEPKNDKECIFCTKSKSKKDKDNFIIYRGKKSFALLNIFPYNSGHVMVAPYAHFADLEGLDTIILYEMLDLVKIVSKKIKLEFKPQGFNIGMNIGRPAGAGFDKHIHLHIVPRWAGDTNFMPVINDEDVISESLVSVYDKLKL